MIRFDPRGKKISWPVLGLLVVTVGLIVFAWFRGREDTAVAPVANVPPRVANAANAANAASQASAASANEEPPQPASSVDLFPSQTWQPPPPPPPPSAAAIAKAPPPEPPPLPFVVRSLWLGSRGDLYIVLTAQGKDYPLCVNCQKKGFFHKGDVIANVYKIESIDRQHASFMFLPLKRQQQMSFGELK